jgi:hypothetical protein
VTDLLYGLCQKSVHTLLQRSYRCRARLYLVTNLERTAEFLQHRKREIKQQVHARISMRSDTILAFTAVQGVLCFWVTQ